MAIDRELVLSSFACINCERKHRHYFKFTKPNR